MSTGSNVHNLKLAIILLFSYSLLSMSSHIDHFGSILPSRSYSHLPHESQKKTITSKALLLACIGVGLAVGSSKHNSSGTVSGSAQYISEPTPVCVYNSNSNWFTVSDIPSAVQCVGFSVDGVTDYFPVVSGEVSFLNTFGVESVSVRFYEEFNNGLCGTMADINDSSCQGEAVENPKYQNV
jgi:hypothetical protein